MSIIGIPFLFPPTPLATTATSASLCPKARSWRGASGGGGGEISILIPVPLRPRLPPPPSCCLILCRAVEGPLPPPSLQRQVALRGAVDSSQSAATVGAPFLLFLPSPSHSLLSVSICVSPRLFKLTLSPSSSALWSSRCRGPSAPFLLMAIGDVTYSTLTLTSSNRARVSTGFLVARALLHSFASSDTGMPPLKSPLFPPPPHPPPPPTLEFRP